MNDRLMLCEPLVDRALCASYMGSEALSIDTESPLQTGEVLRSAKLRAAFAYWTRIKCGNEVPLRRDLDPMEIGAELLPYSLLADVDASLKTVSHRVVGTAFTDFFGRDITGLDLSSVLEGSYREFIVSLYTLACERRAPVVSHSKFRWDQGRFLKTSRLMMPLSKDGSSADMCYTCQIFESGEGPTHAEVFLAAGHGWEDISARFSHLGDHSS